MSCEPVTSGITFTMSPNEGFNPPWLLRNYNQQWRENEAYTQEMQRRSSEQAAARLQQQQYDNYQAELKKHVASFNVQPKPDRVYASLPWADLKIQKLDANIKVEEEEPLLFDINLQQHDVAHIPTVIGRKFEELFSDSIINEEGEVSDGVLVHQFSRPLVPTGFVCAKKKNSQVKRGRRGGGMRGAIPRNFSSRNPNWSAFGVNIVPAELHVQLQQQFLFNLQGAVTVQCRRYNPNSAYQPEVGGATATVPGFSEQAQTYGFYRVMGYKYKATFVNNEAFGVAVGAINSNNDPGTSAGIIVAANDLSQKKYLSAKGGMDKAVTTARYTIARVLGSDAVEEADSYRGLITGNPSDITWLGIFAQSMTGSNLTLGVTVCLELTMYIKFYDRNLQT
jgi:hypothetical protein